jgi:hypothetical protein
MAHPNGKLWGHAFQKLALSYLPHRRQAVLAAIRRLDATATEIAQELKTITDSQDRNSQFENLGSAMRGSFLIDGARATRQNYSLGFDLADSFRRNTEWMDFAIHPQLANSPGNQLCILRSKIENEDGFKIGRHQRLLAVLFEASLDGS